MLGLKAIEKVLHSNHAGIKSITITSLDNLQSGHQVSNASELFEIHFRKNTAELQARGSEGKGGFFTLYSLLCFLPQRRAVVEYMIQQLANRRFVAYCTDRNGHVTWLVPARMAYSYSSGKRLGGDNGYTFTFAGVNTHRVRYVQPTILDPYGNEGTTPGDSTGTPSGPTTGGGPSSDVYVRIIPAQLAGIPTATGNSTNLNKFVTASDGTKWFIDIDGRGIQLEGGDGARETIYITGNGTSSYPLITTIPTDGADANLLLARNGSTMKHIVQPEGVSALVLPTKPNEYDYSGGNIILAADWPLEADEWIRVHKF